VINKIAAGEVIERPASVIKELMENAIDAGATRIDVAVEKGGIERIRVTDNGRGIAADEMPLAVAAHATSKIHDADDLFRVNTLGFRGEALASIAEISRFSLRSRPHDCEAATELEVVGGAATEVIPAASPPGTTIEVQQLFFNTPVRRKFMRSTQTEMGHVGEAFIRLALAYPAVHFTLRHNGRHVHDLPPADPWKPRIEKLFGRELAEQLIWVQSNDEQAYLQGYVAHPSQSRSHQRMQYLLLNGRFIRDRSLQHALREAYRGLLLTGRHPIAFLQLQIPPEMVDVNVHPTKLEVRFQESGRLYSQVLGTIRNRFLTTDLTTRLSARGAGGQDAAPSDNTPAPISTVTQTAFEADDQTEQQRAAISAWARQQASLAAASGNATGEPSQAGAPFSPTGRDDSAFHQGDSLQGGSAPEGGRAFDHPDDQDEASRLNLWRIARPQTSNTSGENARGAAALVSHPPMPVSNVQASNAPDSHVPVSHVPAPHTGATPTTRTNVPPSGRAIQVHNRYLIAESPHGMLIVDQHALHERILYEQLRERVLQGALESQALLVPEPVDLSSAEAAEVLDQRELLAKLGLQIEPFGGDTVLLSSYPAMLANIRPGDILRGLADQLLSGGKKPDRRDLLDELLHMISCKAAVKAGDVLTPQEITALLELREQVQDSHHCPHGRPTELVFSREDLDRQFKRT
jgi:DNA mismatch repair protein MutL